MEEQAFTEAWGLKAKRVFTRELLDTLDPKDQKLMSNVMVLGAANLPPEERGEVSVECFRVNSLPKTEL